MQRLTYQLNNFIAKGTEVLIQIVCELPITSKPAVAFLVQGNNEIVRIEKYNMPIIMQLY